MRTTGIWTHDNDPGNIYIGKYIYNLKKTENLTSSDRVFVISCPLNKKQFNFESWQEARDLGWKKIN